MRRCPEVLLAMAVSITPACAADIWLAGVDPFVRHAMDPSSPSDYMALFASGAPWAKASRHVKVFKTSTQWLEQAPDADLRQMIRNLKSRGIALAVEALMIPHPSLDSPGTGVEGFSDNPSGMQYAAQRVQALGGTLDYVAMHEPLWFGHHYAGPNGPQWPIERLVQELNSNVRIIRNIFPQAQIGDVEPIATDVAGWADQIAAFAQVFQAVTGTSLSFVHADVAWRNPTGFLGPLRDFTDKMRALGIKVGYIYNGDARDVSDQAWADRAAERFGALELQAVDTPDHAVLQTWMPHPTHMLPDSRSDTMTGMVNRYAKTAVTLSLTRGTPVTGRLQTVLGGAAVSGATVTITALGDGSPTGKLVTRTLTGTVPAQAVDAVPIVRINTEGVTNGAADVIVGPVTLAQSNQTTKRRFKARRYTVTAPQKVSTNADPVPVTPGTEFRFTVPMRTPYASTGTGYVGVVFQDRHGDEISRAVIPFQAAAIWRRNVETDSTGSYSVIPPVYTQRTLLVLLADYAGDACHRPVSLFPQ